jgi:hypothetical protein
MFWVLSFCPILEIWKNGPEFKNDHSLVLQQTLSFVNLNSGYTSYGGGGGGAAQSVVASAFVLFVFVLC